MCIDLVCRTPCDIHTYSSNSGHAFESFMLRCKSVQGYCWRRKLSDTFENPCPMPPFPPVQSWQDDTFGNPPPHDPLPLNTKLTAPWDTSLIAAQLCFGGSGGRGKDGDLQKCRLIFSVNRLKFHASLRFPTGLNIMPLTGLAMRLDGMMEERFTTFTFWNPEVNENHMFSWKTLEDVW